MTISYRTLARKIEPTLYCRAFGIYVYVASHARTFRESPQSPFRWDADYLVRPDEVHHPVKAWRIAYERLVTTHMLGERDVHRN